MAKKQETDKSIKLNREESWSPRKFTGFIDLNRINPEERAIVTFEVEDDSGGDFEKIKFKCQPKSKDINHSSMDNISPSSPIKEIVYRILVSSKKPMKLGDIVEKTLEIVKRRVPPFRLVDEDINKYFYRILSEDTYYGFEEVK